MQRYVLRVRPHAMIPSSPSSESQVKTYAADRDEEGVLTRFWRRIAVQDVFVTVYFTVLTLAVVMGNGPDRPHCLRVLAVDMTALLLGFFVTRGGIIPYGNFWNSFLYRVTIWIPLFLSYFQLREILPAVTTRALDAQILAFDLRVFGFEPAIAWDQYVTPTTTEWFSFFYFGYFFILVANTVPMILFSKNMSRLAHFSFGLVMVFCFGHLGYTLVPGYGPHQFLHFHNELEGGFFWALVEASVNAGGAMKDIFPSLHTAVPTYFTLFAFWHRKAFPFRYAWPVLLFCITQIIGATMFLRWHYLIDICAGLTLATFAVTVSAKVTRWEHARRMKAGIGPAYRQLEWPRIRQVEED